MIEQWHWRMTCRVVLTGFGRFQGVDDNPTSRLVPRLQELLPAVPGVELVVSDVLEVSAVECLRFLDKHKAHRECVYVHLGVASSRTEVCLEECAYNMADFRCPDEKGWAPCEFPIERSFDTDKCRKSQLPLSAICAKLQTEFGEQVRMSDDAGRFLCNYIFYNSLARGLQSVFVHVPPFEAIPMREQLRIVCALIAHIRDETLMKK